MWYGTAQEVTAVIIARLFAALVPDSNDTSSNVPDQVDLRGTVLRPAPDKQRTRRSRPGPQERALEDLVLPAPPSTPA